MAKKKATRQQNITNLSDREYEPRPKHNFRYTLCYSIYNSGKKDVVNHHVYTDDRDTVMQLADCLSKHYPVVAYDNEKPDEEGNPTIYCTF